MKNAHTLQDSYRWHLAWDVTAYKDGRPPFHVRMHTSTARFWVRLSSSDRSLQSVCMVVQIVAATRSNGHHDNAVNIVFNYVVPLGFLIGGILFTKW